MNLLLKICAHINLIFYASALNLTCWIVYTSIDWYSDHMNTTYHGLWFEAHAVVSILLYLLEIVCTIMLLFGAYLRHVKCIWIYYWYGVSTTLGTIIGVMFIFRKAYFDNLDYDPDFELHLYNICGLVFQSLYLWVVWFELQHLRKLSVYYHGNFMEDEDKEKLLSKR